MTERLSSPGFGVRVKSAARALLQGAVEMLLFFFIVLWFYIYISPLSFFSWMLALAVCYPAGNLIAGFVRVRKAAIFYGILLVVSAIPAWAMFGGTFSFRLIIAWLLIGFILSRGALMFIRPWIDVFPNFAYVIGLIGYFIASILSGGALDSWQPFALAVQWLGLISLALTLFMTNRFHLNRSAPAGFTVSRIIASRNWIWLSVLFIVIMVFSYFSVIGRLLKAAVGFIVYVVATVLSWLLPSTPKADIQPNAAPIVPLETTEVEHSIWDQIAYYAAKGLLFLVAALVIAGLGYLIFIWTAKLILRLLHARNPFSAGQGFVDEKKRLLDTPERSRWGSRFRQRIGVMLKRELRWEQITDGRERVRWLYRRRLKKAMRLGYELNPNLTPQEALQDLRAWEKKNSDQTRDLKLATLYDEARYGNRKAVNEAEITELYENQ